MKQFQIILCVSIISYIFIVLTLVLYNKFNFLSVTEHSMPYMKIIISSLLNMHLEVKMNLDPIKKFNFQKSFL